MLDWEKEREWVVEAVVECGVPSVRAAASRRWRGPESSALQGLSDFDHDTLFADLKENAGE